MLKEVVMPRLSDTMSEGTVSKWRKQPGEPIQKGEIIAEIETDKATQELESYDTGVVSQILVAEGATVPLGTAIAVIALPGEGAATPAAAGQYAAPPVPTPTPVAQTPAPPAASTEAPTPPAATPEEEERLRVSPIARRIAQEHGIDLLGIPGTGPGGRIVKEDVEAVLRARTAAPGAPPPPPPAVERPAAAPPVSPTAPPVGGAPTVPEAEEVIALTRMQQAIARRLVQSKVEAPHFYVTTEIDMTEASAFRRSLNEAQSGLPSISFNDFVIKAVALTLQKFPLVNASWDSGRLILHSQINVGFAIAMPDERGPGGLIVPVVVDADEKSLRQIATNTRALIDKGRTGHITERDLSGATFSVSNLGMFDVEQFTAIISPPQSAILAVGSIVKQPVVKDDQIAIADRMRVTLSVDHRVFYGATAAQFLQELKRILEHPMTMV